METARTLHRQLTTDSRTTSLPIPSLSWLTTLIPTTRGTSRIPPLPSLLATARLRLLSSDLCTPGLLDPNYISSHSFPPSITTITTTSHHPSTAGYPKDQPFLLPQDVLVQVLDIVNLSRSKWEVVEELESIERGEQTRGREVIRLPTTSTSNSNTDGSNSDFNSPDDPNEGTATTQVAAQQQQAQAREKEQQRKNATHKLTIQDPSGQRLYALELKRVEEIAVPQFVNGRLVSGMPIGCKLLLKKGTKVARGVVLLEPGMVKVVGGRVEGWGRVWEGGRLEKVRGEVRGEVQGQ